MFKDALNDHPVLTKKRYWLHDTKKLGSEATIHVKKINTFPSFYVDDTKYSKNKVFSYA